jgi:hypothetical protein
LYDSAPEEINYDLIQKGQYPSNVNPCLAEVFSIGLTILSSGTLEDCDSVYQSNPLALRKDRLNSLLKIFKERYSDYLYQTVASLLAINPGERKRSSEIYRVLSEYESQILDLEPFQVQNYRPPLRPSFNGYPNQSNNAPVPGNYRPVDQIVQQPQQVQQVPQYYGYGQSGQKVYQAPVGNYQQFNRQNNIPMPLPVYHGNQK